MPQSTNAATTPNSIGYSNALKQKMAQFEQADKMGEANLFTKAEYLIEAIELAAPLGIEAADVKKSAAYSRGKDVTLMSHWVAGGMMVKTLRSNLSPGCHLTLDKWMSEGRPPFSHYVSLWYLFKGSKETLSPLDCFNFLQDAYNGHMGKNALKAHVIENTPALNGKDKDDTVAEEELQKIFRRDVTRSFYDVLPLVSDPRTPAIVRDLADQLTTAMQNEFSWLKEADKE